MTIKVLLIVQEEESKLKYLDALTECGVQVFTSSSFIDLSEEVCIHKYSGLFFDLPTKMKAIKKNKAYVYNLAGKFPVSNLQIDNKTERIRCFNFGEKPSSNLLEFISNQCANFTPQRIRDDPRKDLNIHLLLYKKKSDKRPELSVTKNISAGGCFIFSTRKWEEGTDIWIRFKEIPNRTLMQAQIRTVTKWGESRQIPGIGVKFINLSPTQAEEIARMINTG